MKTLTLSGGTRLPKGTMISAPIAMFSTDSDFVEDPETFDGFRWYKKSLEAEGRATQTTWTTISARDLAFGHGRHACPGRFFASDMTMTLLSFFLSSSCSTMSSTLRVNLALLTLKPGSTSLLILPRNFRAQRNFLFCSNWAILNSLISCSSIHC